MRSGKRALPVSALILALTACSSAQTPNKSNFGKGIQEFLDTRNGLCAAIPAHRIPFKLPSKSSTVDSRSKQAEALVRAGLLQSHDSEVVSSFGLSTLPAKEYSLTGTGRKFLVENAAESIMGQAAFCTGKLKVTEVDTFTDPSEMMGMKLSQVNFRYRATDVDGWAKSQEILDSYPVLADQIKGDINGKATLVLTNNGWMHERLFRR